MALSLTWFASLFKVALLSKEDDIEADFERQVSIFPLLSVFKHVIQAQTDHLLGLSCVVELNVPKSCTCSCVSSVEHHYFVLMVCCCYATG